MGLPDDTSRPRGGGPPALARGVGRKGSCQLASLRCHSPLQLAYRERLRKPNTRATVRLRSLGFAHPSVGYFESFATLREPKRPQGGGVCFARLGYAVFAPAVPAGPRSFAWG